MGLSSLCTVGAAEFAPPASGRTALFSNAMELDVLSSPLPEVAVPVVVQLVSGFSLEGAVDCAAAGPTINVAEEHSSFDAHFLTPMSKVRSGPREERPITTMVSLGVGREHLSNP